jgi:hypothetical protein
MAMMPCVLWDIGAGARLLPTVQQPISLLIPPGSLGPSAAAAAAGKRCASAGAAGNDDRAAAAAGIEDQTRSPVSGQTSNCPEAGGLKAAGKILQGLLNDVWADHDVAAACADLPLAPVSLYLEQMQGGQQGSSQCLVATRGEEANAWTAEVVSSIGDLASPAAPPAAADPAAAGAAALKFAEYVLNTALLGIFQEKCCSSTIQQAT